MTLQELYKKQILEERPTQDMLRIQQAYKLMGFRENNRAKQTLSEVQGELKSQAYYLLSIIAQFEKNEDSAARHLEEASAAPEYRLLLYAYRKEEIASDIAEEMAKALSKKKMSAYASLCECYRTLPLPSADTREKLLHVLQNDQINAKECSLEHNEHAARKEKDEKLSEASEELEKERSEAEIAREKKRANNHPSSVGPKAAAKKEEPSGAVKILLIGLKLCRFIFAYFLAASYLLIALVNTANDSNCGGVNKLMILLPLIIWMICIFVVKFKVLKQCDDNHTRVTGAWWLFYLPTTFVLIYRSFLARQEALMSAGACFFTALVTCLLLAPQVAFLLSSIKNKRNRDDFYAASLCGVVCFVLIPILCLYFTDASMDNFWAGVSAAVQSNK